MGENLTIEDLFKLNEKYLDDEEFSVDGIDNDNFEEYYFDRCCKFFDADYEQVKKLVGKCFMRADGKLMLKIIGVRDDVDNKYWNSCKYWQAFIYEEIYKYTDGKWYFDDYHNLQESYNDDLAKFRFTPYCNMNTASEEMYHIGKDNCLYVDYGCDGNYEKFVEVNSAQFDEAREVAVKEFKEELK